MKDIFAEYIRNKYDENPGIKATQIVEEWDLWNQHHVSDGAKINSKMPRPYPKLRTVQNYLKKLRNERISVSENNGPQIADQDEKEEPKVSNNPTVDIIKNAVQDPEVMNALAPVFQGIVEKIVDAKLNNLIEQAQTQAQPQPTTAENGTSQNGQPNSAIEPSPGALPTVGSGKYDAILQQLLPVMLQKLIPTQQPNSLDALTQVLPQYMQMAQSINQMFLAPFLGGMEVANNMVAQSYKMGNEPQNIASATESAIQSIKNGAMYGKTDIQNPTEQKTG